jgi:class 3 adenylate cyclase
VKIPEIRYARSGAVNVAYQVLGAGPVDLVFVRGHMADLDTAWQQPLLAGFFQKLAAFSRLILLEKRGMGLSDRVREAPTLETRMDDVRAVMDAAGSEQAIFFAGYEGARMVLLFAATYPERAAALALANPTARSISTPEHPWGRTDQEWRELLREVGERWGSEEYFEQMLRKLNPSVADDPAFQSWYSSYLRHSLSPGAAVTYYRMLRDADVTDILPSIRVPTVIFRGAREPEAVSYVADRIPGARVVELPGFVDIFTWVDPAADAVIVQELESLAASAGRPSEPDRILATILFVDIVGSTQMAAELGDTRWHDLLIRFYAAVRSELSRFRGRELDTAGDGMFASFEGPARAIQAAVAIRRSITGMGFEVRAGVHTGECQVIGDKPGGIAVHIGARVAALARAGEVLVSSTVKDLVAGSGIEFEERGTHELKGVPGEWRLYAVSSA